MITVYEQKPRIRMKFGDLKHGDYFCFTCDVSQDKMILYRKLNGEAVNIIENMIHSTVSDLSVIKMKIVSMNFTDAD
jgi:hypothetical protein